MCCCHLIHSVILIDLLRFEFLFTFLSQTQLRSHGRFQGQYPPNFFVLPKMLLCLEYFVLNI